MCNKLFGKSTDLTIKYVPLYVSPTQQSTKSFVYDRKEEINYKPITVFNYREIDRRSYPITRRMYLLEGFPVYKTLTEKGWNIHLKKSTLIEKRLSILHDQYIDIRTPPIL